MTVPFLSFQPANEQIKDEMLAAYQTVFNNQWYVLGREVTAFEKEYAAFNRVSHCVGVSNGLDALQLCLKSLGIREGDEVIVPSNTYIATLLAVSFVGAKPVLVEPDKATYNIDPKSVEGAITARTKVVMPVHLYGQCCQMDEIMEIANRHRLFVVEDNAQSQGAACNNHLAGSFGHINATSFYPGKNLGALGDAGGITSNDGSLSQAVRVLRNYGSQKKYYNEVVGHNMRLDELQAAFLRVKLKYLPLWTEERRRIAGWYGQHLQGVGDLVLPVVAHGCTHVYHLYVIRTKRRDKLQTFLTAQGIGTLIHYPVPPHLQQAYGLLGHKKGDFPVAEELAVTCLSLPIWPGLSEAAVAQVASVIKSFFRKP